MEEDSCVHYWIIESASGGVKSSGTCKKCHRTQLFQNSVVETKHLYNGSRKDKEQS